LHRVFFALNSSPQAAGKGAMAAPRKGKSGLRNPARPCRGFGISRERETAQPQPSPKDIAQAQQLASGK